MAGGVVGTACLADMAGRIIGPAQASGGYGRFTGTSFATPHVTGLLARCRAGGGTAAACNERLRQSARDAGEPGQDETYGYGIVD